MNSNTAFVLGIVLSLGSSTLGGIKIGVNIGERPLATDYRQGDSIFVSVYVDASNRERILGVELTFETSGKELLIAGAQPEAGWEMPATPDAAAVPTKRKAFVLHRPASSIRESALDLEDQVLLATVELEVQQNGKLNELLKVTASVVVEDLISVDTVVFDSETGVSERKPGVSSNVLRLISGRQVEAGYPRGANHCANLADARPWTESEGQAAISVHDPRTGEEAVTLEAGRIYELHYDVGSLNVSGYVAYTVSDSEGATLAAAMLPANGDWSNTGSFRVDLYDEQQQAAAAAPGYDTGFFRHDSITDMQPLGPSAMSGGAPSTGHLFDFIPVESGPCTLDVTLLLIDQDRHNVTSMAAQVAFDVNASIGE